MKNYINRHIRVFREAIASIEEQMVLKPGVNVTTGNLGTPAQQAVIARSTADLERANRELVLRTIEQLRAAAAAARRRLTGGVSNVVIASQTPGSTKTTVTPAPTTSPNPTARPGSTGYVPPTIKR